MKRAADHAPDGSPIAVYARLPPMGEPELVHAAVPAGAEILELGAGAGRLTHPLVALGHPVVAVDESPEMLALIRGAETVLGDIRSLRLGRRFAVVLLASNFINEPDVEERRGFLACCARHVAWDGHVLLEGFPRDWVPRHDWVELGGVRARLRRCEQEGPLVAGEMEYVVDGRSLLHPFRSRLLTEEELDADLCAVGLERRRFLDERGAWVEAAPSSGTEAR